MATNFDYAHTSTGYPTAWSEEKGPPYQPASDARMRRSADPRFIRLYDTVAVTVVFDGEPLITAHVIGPGENLTNAFYYLAQHIDTLKPDLMHAFSSNNLIGVQPAFGHTAEIGSVLITPYRRTPSPTILVPAPVVVPSEPATISLSVVRDGLPEQTFSVAATGNVGVDLVALAAAIDEDPWLGASADIGHLRLSVHAGHVVSTAGPVVYG